MSGPGITPENTQATQLSQDSQGRDVGLQHTAERSSGGPVNPVLAAALGGQENLMSLLSTFAQMNKLAMEQMMGRISKLIDEKVAAAIPISQSSVGLNSTPVTAPEIIAVGTSQNEEVVNKMRPKLILDEDGNPKRAQSTNEFLGVVRNVYERFLKSWEKWVDCTSEKKDRMILEVRQHFKNGSLLSESTIKSKLGAAGRNRREYLHSVIKSYDGGDCDLEKLRKIMSEEVEQHIREQQNSKLNQTAVETQKKKKVFIHRMGATGVAKFKTAYEKKTGKKGTLDIIRKAKLQGIAAVYEEYQFNADQEDFPSEDEQENEDGDKDASEENEDEEVDEPEDDEEDEAEDNAPLIPTRRGNSNRTASTFGGRASSSQSQRKKKRVPDSQFAQNPHESDEDEDEDLHREERRKKSANDARRQLQVKPGPGGQRRTRTTSTQQEKKKPSSR